MQVSAPNPDALEWLEQNYDDIFEVRTHHANTDEVVRLYNPMQRWSQRNPYMHTNRGPGYSRSLVGLVEDGASCNLARTKTGEGVCGCFGDAIQYIYSVPIEDHEIEHWVKAPGISYHNSYIWSNNAEVRELRERHKTWYIQALQSIPSKDWALDG